MTDNRFLEAVKRVRDRKLEGLDPNSTYAKLVRSTVNEDGTVNTKAIEEIVRRNAGE